MTDNHRPVPDERDAARYIADTCFVPAPPGRVGVELEWLVRDVLDPGRAVPLRRVEAVVDALGDLPGGGRLSLEPGGQLELSSAAAESLPGCLDAAAGDLGRMRAAAAGAGLALVGLGLDTRPPLRVLDAPRYAAMERFFDRGGRWGRLMMCTSASVQVCVDVGTGAGDPHERLARRWRAAHRLGPVLLAAFANSPFLDGEPSGWASTRQFVWSRMDHTRTRPPAEGDPAREWARYVLDAPVMCIRDDDGEGRAGAGARAGAPAPAPAAPWRVPRHLTFRDWIRDWNHDHDGPGRRRRTPRPPTTGDLDYHLSTLFPPVRPRGTHLELRMIDAQDGDTWPVVAAVAAALFDDPVAARAADAATAALDPRLAPAPYTWWLRAARHGPADPEIGEAARRCFAAAAEALPRMGCPPTVTAAVADFRHRYVERGRCPADDRLGERGHPAPRPAGPFPKEATHDDPAPV